METTLTNDDILALLEKAQAAGEDIYDTAVNAGMKAASEQDMNKYFIGDLAGLVHKKYGMDMIGQFATAINMEKARVKEYRGVCAFWQKDARADILANMPSLTYSHLRLAMRLKDPNEALSFLEECAADSWTVEQAGIELKKRTGGEIPPAILIDLTTLSYEVDMQKQTITFGIAPHIGLSVLKDLHQRRERREPVRLVLKEGK